MASERPFLRLQIFGALLILIGLALLAGGAMLAAAGGSPAYLLAGVGFAASGVLLTLAFAIPPFQLMTYLGFFAGFLLYIGVSDILPEAHSRAGPGVATKLIALTCCGAAFVYAVVRLSP